MNQLAVLVAIVIHESDRRTSQLSIVEQLAEQQLARIPGAIDENAFALPAIRPPQHLAEYTKGDATCGKQREHNDAIQQEYDARESLKTKLEKDNDDANY